MSAYARSDNLRNLSIQVDRDAIDSGAGPGTIKIYTAPRPAKGGAITTQELWCTCTFSKPCAPDPENGILQFNSITASDVMSDDDANWARIENSEGFHVADVDVGINGSGAPVQVSQLGPGIGSAVTVSAAAITAGNA